MRPQTRQTMCAWGSSSRVLGAGAGRRRSSGGVPPRAMGLSVVRDRGRRAGGIAVGDRTRLYTFGRARFEPRQAGATFLSRTPFRTPVGEERSVTEPARNPGSALPRLVLLGVLWGATFPISRYGVDAGANPFVLVTIAFAIAAAGTAPVAAARQRTLPSARSLAESAGVGALLIGGINLPLFWGERFATGGVASIVYATAPMVSLLFVALLGTGERVGLRGASALGLGLAGVAVLALASGGAAISSVWGLGAFGLGAVCQGAGAVTLGRLRPHGEGAWGETFQFVGGGAVSAVVVAAAVPRPSIAWSGPVVASVAYVGIASMAIGYAVFFDLVRHHGAVEANQVTFLNPVVALLLGVVVFAEPFAFEEVGGLGLVLLALALLHLRAPRTPRPEAADARFRGGDGLPEVQGSSRTH